jgi:hypothetical protein
MATLYTLNWTNTHTSTTVEEYLSYASVYGSTTVTIPMPATNPNYTLSDSVTKHNIFYDFGVSAKCTNTTISSVTSSLNNIKWLVPSGSPSYTGTWGYVSTNDTISVWFDSVDLDKCRMVEIALYSGSSLVGNTQTFIAPAGPAVFAQNLKRVVFSPGTGYTLTADTTYTVKLTLYAAHTTAPNTLIPNTPTSFTVTTQPYSSAYKQWIVIGGNTNADPCNIKYQFVIQTHPSATLSTITHGVEHVYTNFLTSSSLGGVHPFVSPSMNLNYIRLLETTNVYNYDGINSVFGTPLASSYNCLY